MQPERPPSSPAADRDASATGRPPHGAPPDDASAARGAGAWPGGSAGTGGERTRGPLRWTLLLLGWLFVGLGLAGTVLPVLPTTPFLLLAAWCWARSSQRFHGWLLRHRIFGSILRAWAARRALPPGVKPKAIALVVVVFAASLTWGTEATWHRLLLGVTGTALVVFLARLPVWDESAAARAGPATNRPMR